MSTALAERRGEDRGRAIDRQGPATKYEPRTRLRSAERDTSLSQNTP